MENKKDRSGCIIRIILALIAATAVIVAAVIGILPYILDRLEANSNTPIANIESTREEAQGSGSGVIIIPTNAPEPTSAPTFTFIPQPTSTSPPLPTNPPSPTEISLPAGSVSHYTFSGNGNDSAGNNIAIIQGATYTTGRAGRSNSALQFNGVSDYVQLPNESAFDLTSFTIIVWLKLNSLGPGDDWIISKGSQYGNFSITRTGSNSEFWAGYASYVHVTQSGNWSSVASSQALPVNQFFCLAISMGGSNFRSYVNGQLARSAGNVTPPTLNDSPVYIGAGGINPVSEYFSGVIDEVQIYSRVLSDSEIAQQCR